MTEDMLRAERDLALAMVEELKKKLLDTEVLLMETGEALASACVMAGKEKKESDAEIARLKNLNRRGRVRRDLKTLSTSELSVYLQVARAVASLLEARVCDAILGEMRNG